MKHKTSVVVALPFMRTVAWVLMTLLGPLVVKNRHKIPSSGGVLILANHQSDLDPVIVQMACKRPIHFMAKSELFHIPVLKWFIAWYGAFPVKRGTADKASLERAISLLEAGEVVCIFPEGKLSKSGELLPLSAGAEVVARRSGATVLCMGLCDTRRIMPHGVTLLRPSFRKVIAHVGEPYSENSSAQPLLDWAESELQKLKQR